MWCCLWGLFFQFLPCTRHISKIVWWLTPGGLNYGDKWEIGDFKWGSISKLHTPTELYMIFQLTGKGLCPFDPPSEPGGAQPPLDTPENMRLISARRYFSQHRLAHRSGPGRHSMSCFRSTNSFHMIISLFFLFSGSHCHILGHCYCTAFRSYCGH